MYIPLAEMVPMAGLSDHFTPEFVAPFTVAVNDCWRPALRVTEDGLMLTDTVDAGGGVRVTVALADFVVSAAEVAVMVTVCWAAIVAGAV